MHIFFFKVSSLKGAHMSLTSFFSQRKTQLPTASLFVLLLFSLSPSGIAIRTTFHSALIDTDITYSVALPSDYEQKIAQGHRYPVVYLLHCAGCTDSTWLGHYFNGIFPAVDSVIDSVDLIAAAPYNGPGFSWWIDSPVKPKSFFSSFLVREFKHLIDSLYATLPRRESSGIAGHSMGGFGALFNCGAHPDSFSAAYSCKGLLNVLQHHGEFGLDEVLGGQDTSITNWHAVDIIENARKFAEANAAGKAVRIIFYSGPNDWFQAENRLFDTTLTDLSVPHEYFENEEDHGLIWASRMFEVLKWFDTVLVHQRTGAVKNPGGHRFRTTYSTHASSGKQVMWDLSGRVIRPGKAAAGIVIELLDPSLGRNGRFVCRFLEKKE